MNIKNGFTLIELMIAITILVLLTMSAYAPYNYYQNKAKLKITTREVTQLLYESRNMAINGAVGSLGNVSIGVYLDTSNLYKNKIQVFSYPYDIDNLDITYTAGGPVKLLKTLVLKKGIEIDNIDSMNNLLFVFDSITGDLKYYNWSNGLRKKIVDDIIAITFSYKGSTSNNLRKTINYLTNTNIIDY